MDVWKFSISWTSARVGNSITMCSAVEERPYFSKIVGVGCVKWATTPNGSTKVRQNWGSDTTNCSSCLTFIHPRIFHWIWINSSPKVLDEAQFMWVFFMVFLKVEWISEVSWLDWLGLVPELLIASNVYLPVSFLG